MEARNGGAGQETLAATERTRGWSGGCSGRGWAVSGDRVWTGSDREMTRWSLWFLATLARTHLSNSSAFPKSQRLHFSSRRIHLTFKSSGPRSPVLATLSRFKSPLYIISPVIAPGTAFPIHRSHSNFFFFFETVPVSSPGWP